MSQRSTNAVYRPASNLLGNGLLRADVALISLVLVLLIITGGAG